MYVDVEVEVELGGWRLVFGMRLGTGLFLIWISHENGANFAREGREVCGRSFTS